MQATYFDCAKPSLRARMGTHHQLFTKTRLIQFVLDLILSALRSFHLIHERLPLKRRFFFDFASVIVGASDHSASLANSGQDLGG